LIIFSGLNSINLTLKSINMNRIFLVFASILSFVIVGFSQSEPTQTGLPGDHFSLEGALDLFREASSPEDFEKKLNQESSHVNNIDLDDDGEIDYVKVIEKHDGDLRLYILQVTVSDSESQDIAVIELEKTNDADAILQIVGDSEIYGEEIIIEPSNGDDTDDNSDIDHKAKKGGPSVHNEPSDLGIVVNVWGWPCVRHVYAPSYRPWVSSYRWRIYPKWYRPWRPLSWSVWHPFRYRVRPTVRIVQTHRVVRAHNVYKPVRTTSRTVNVKYKGAHNNYKVSKSKTTVTGPRGNSRTKTTTSVKTPRGKATKTTTKVKKGRH
jgi:hypothetical protein